MSRPPRNPRRAYDADGREIPPMTLGNMREHGVRSALAACQEALRSLGLGERGQLARRLPGAGRVSAAALLGLRLSECENTAGLEAGLVGTELRQGLLAVC
jgi:hypothetical protein